MPADWLLFTMAIMHLDPGYKWSEGVYRIRSLGNRPVQSSDVMEYSKIDPHGGSKQTTWPDKLHRRLSY